MPSLMKKMLRALSYLATVANQVTEGAVSLSNEIRQNATLSEIKSSEKFCLEMGYKLSDEIPLEGKAAVIVARLILDKETKKLNELVEGGVLVVLPYTSMK